MRLKAAIFDLGSVLATNEWPLVYAKIEAASKVDRGKLKEIIAPLLKKWCAGKIGENDFWAEFKKQSNATLPKRFTKNFWSKTYKKWSREIKGTWDIARELHAKKIRLALLSNIIKPHVVANEEMGRFQKLRDIGFEALVYSYKEKAEKPDPRMYTAVLKKLKLPARNCIMIDDKLNVVRGAGRLGMRGILFRTPEQLRKDLIVLGLL